MKIFIATILLLFSTLAHSVESQIAVSVTKTNIFDAWDGDDDKHGFMMSYESADKYPFTLTYQYTPKYSIVDAHSSVGIGKQARYYIGREFYLYGEAGGLVNSHKTEASSTYFNFYGSVGLAYDDFRVGIKHVSNAYTGSINEGEDVLYISYIF